MAIKQDIANLQKQINELKEKEDSPFTTSVTTNLFSRSGERKIEQGSTGSARYRKLDIPNRTQHYTTSTRGNFTTPTAYIEWADNTTLKIWGFVPIPSDAIAGGFPTINMLWSSTEATNSIDWKWTLVSEIKDGDNDETTLLAESSFTSFSAPSTTNTLTVISTRLTIPPTPNSFISVRCSRDGNSDTNSGLLCTWSMWLEYLAHS